MLIISDNSTLSALAEIGELDILQDVFGTVIITATVHLEATAPNAPEALRTWSGSPPPWLSIVPDPTSLLSETTCLGPGEATAITLAWLHRPESFLILDERLGRRIAALLGLPMTGLLGILADAANQGLLDFEATISRLQGTSFRISEAVIEAARRRLTP